MALLQYTSNEMFSSTELIRKSKTIFDKLNSEEIEKAIILRDGKPSFMLLDFNVYENLIREYLELKELNKDQKKEKQIIQNNPINSDDQKSDLQSSHNIEEINDNDLKDALQKIDKLEFNLDDNNLEVNEKTEALKEFWD